MTFRDYDELAEFLGMLRALPAKDQRFLKKLIVELARRDWTGTTSTPTERILEVTRDIAPDRLAWIQRRLSI